MDESGAAGPCISELGRVFSFSAISACWTSLIRDCVRHRRQCAICPLSHLLRHKYLPDVLVPSASQSTVPQRIRSAMKPLARSPSITRSACSIRRMSTDADAAI
ncbi:uncharacterized protein PHACADRAFT_178089 [Phanerochaete carnosa HHB-10118-sp]|uniref:Uncharacterized protein n=1 Tax=Phanerochaete carnosa (strain HHB-10118-sp) TaxID=650164 RepID=K5UNX7_PHACS|nr:uncharacterized protein PHACADRAFT_178089 [Phanerochaete carnosa HHB-10118-sp]EKM51461.1 hypothetical protein PHACADRAFT_178089 [Phanerochaete carnosa HHB-10118-sp]